MEKKKVEILAPAGSFASMKAAVAAGADAVYMGGTRFGARAYADNPDEHGLLEAIDYVHLHGCRLYMTVNTLFKEEELGELYEYILPYYRRGLDGVIVQDLGALRFMREHFPGMELHASTQMTITSAYGAKMLMELGCSRIVTARELSLEEIRRIREETGVEIESFVHGALCYCYSGQCLMSSLIGGRSGNRGRCAQPCRLPYRVIQEEGKGQKPIAETRNRGKERTDRQTPHAKGGKKQDQSYVLSLKDLCTLDILPDIIEAGVYSLKIEGRMKSPRYTAGVVSIYRKYVDRYLLYGREGYYVEPEDRRMLLDLFDRGGFTEGYYNRHNGRDMVALKEKPEFREGNQKLFDYLDQTYVDAEVREKIFGQAVLEEGKPSVLKLWYGEAQAEVKGQPVQRAQNQPVTEEKVLKQLMKTGGTPFLFEELSVEIKGDVFLPVQALNELRREGLDALEAAILGPWMREVPEGKKEGEKEQRKGIEEVFGTIKASGTTEDPGRFSVTVSLEEPHQLPPVLSRPEVTRIYLDADGFPAELWKEAAARCRREGKECWLMLPQIFRTEAMDYFEKNLEHLKKAGFDGILVRALEEVQWLKETGISGGEEGLPFGLDASVYAWNSQCIRSLKETGASCLTMPWELNSRELQPVLKSCKALALPGELIVYGRAPMMVSAQCITKTVKGCTGLRGLIFIKDRTGAMLPVKNRCRFCYNTIFNPLPLSLLGNEEDIKRLSPRSIRLSFTIEEEGQTEAVLDACIRAFVYGETGGDQLPFKDFTRGHFKRGVE